MVRNTLAWDRTRDLLLVSQKKDPQARVRADRTLRVLNRIVTPHPVALILAVAAAVVARVKTTMMLMMVVRMKTSLAYDDKTCIVIITPITDLFCTITVSWLSLVLSSGYAKGYRSTRLRIAMRYSDDNCYDTFENHMESAEAGVMSSGDTVTSSAHHTAWGGGCNGWSSSPLTGVMPSGAALTISLHSSTLLLFWEVKLELQLYVPFPSLYRVY